MAGGKDSWIKFFALVALFLFGVVLHQMVDNFHWPTAKVAFVFFVLILLFALLVCQMNRKAYEPMSEGTFVGEHRFVFDEKGIQSESNGCEGRYAWWVVKTIERAEGMILIYLDTASAFVFPESKLNKPDEFYHFITEQYSKAKPTSK